MNPADAAIWKNFFGLVFRNSQTNPIQEYPQQIFDYDGAGKIIYQAIAPRGSDTDDEAWIIQKFTYSGDNIARIQTSVSNQIWDDRTTVTYA